MKNGSPPNVISPVTRWLIGGTGAFLLFVFLYFLGETITGESLLIFLAGASAVAVASWSEDALAESNASRNSVRALCVVAGISEIARATYYYSEGMLADFSWTTSALLGIGLVSAWLELRSYSKPD